MNPIAQTLAALNVGPLAGHLNLTVAPLLARTRADVTKAPDYLLLDEALAQGLAKVTEVSEAGSVPELFFENRSARKILLLDGEELVGARQNRVLNTSILVRPRSQVNIPVSCVERGRWRYSSREFASSGDVMFAKARAQMSMDTAESLRETGRVHADQMAVWDAIDHKLGALEAHSDTDAMEAAFTSRRTLLDEYSRAIKPTNDQVGMVFMIDGEVAGIELFDTTATMKRCLAKLVGSYALDAAETAEAVNHAPRATLEVVKQFLEQVKQSAVEQFPATDLGQELRLKAKGLTGGALMDEGRLVRMAVFAHE